MQEEIETLSVNGIVYEKQGEKKADTLDGMKYCIIRTYSAGVFAGYIDLESLTGKFGRIFKSRRIWKWSGACSLSQLANEGTKNPNDCNFAVIVDETILTEIIEVIPATEKAKKSISEVSEWKS